VNPEIKKAWVEALRSGEYTQARGALCRTEDMKYDEAGRTYKAGYCCLGVLTDLAVKAGVVQWSPEPRAPELQAVVDGTGSWYSLTPPQVVTWAGLDRADPKVGSGGVRLSELNDSGEKDFGQIAKIIEEEL
jgi:hypothetical protein